MTDTIVNPFAKIAGMMPPLIPKPEPVGPEPGPLSMPDDTSVPQFPTSKQPKVVLAPFDPETASPESVAMRPALTRLRKDEYKDLHPWGSEDNHPGLGGKLAHALSWATGGTNRRQAEEMGLANSLQALLGQQAGEAAQKANTQYAEQRPELERLKYQQQHDIADQKNRTALARIDQKIDENGNIVPMEYSEMSPSHQAMYDLRQSQQQLADTTEEYRAAQAEVERAKNDPNSPAYQFALQKLAVARQNAQAAGERAQAYMGRYLQSAFNTDLHGNVLPGATQIADENGHQTVVGTGNAAQAAKSQAGAAQFNDVHGALDSVEDAARKLTQSGGSLNSPQVIAALQAPHSTISQWIHSLNKMNLTPEERNYVTSNIGLHENIQGLRKSAGGAATDSQVQNLLNMAPSGSTPDLDYLLRQTGQIRSTAERLGKGATTAKGGLHVRGQEHQEGQQFPPQGAKIRDYTQLGGK